MDVVATVTNETMGITEGNKYTIWYMSRNIDIVVVENDRGDRVLMSSENFRDVK